LFEKLIKSTVTGRKKGCGTSKNRKEIRDIDKERSLRELLIEIKIEMERNNL
jgi:hypothetical protein